MAETLLYPVKDMIAGTLYRVDRVIGRGGMATVYRVTEMSCGRQFAFKHLNAELRGRRELRALFVAEGKLLGSLHGHPNIPEVFSQGTTADEWELPFIVMELLNGPNGRQVLRKEKRLAVPVACTVVAFVLDGLDHAHNKGVIHRDAKPENVVLHRDMDGKPRPKLIDFGIHKARSELRSSRMVGTPLYMAPELFDDRPHDQATEHLVDIYATGIMLYEFVTGRTPFEHEPNDATLAEAHRSKVPPRPSGFVDGMPVQVEDVILRSIEKDPHKRWPDAFSFAKALRACIDGHAAVNVGAEVADIHTRITREQIPTSVGTPIDDVPTLPGAPHASLTGAVGEGASGTAIPSTEPGVPLEILHMMIEKATAAERNTPAVTPEARRAAANGRLVEEEPPPSTPRPPRLSNVATRSRPPIGSGQARAASSTPVMVLPPVAHDPAAPPSLRGQPIVVLGPPAPSVTNGAADAPDRVWMNEGSGQPQAMPATAQSVRGPAPPFAVAPTPAATRALAPPHQQPAWPAPVVHERVELPLSLWGEFLQLRRKVAASKRGEPIRVTPREGRLFTVMDLGQTLVLLLGLGVLLIGLLWVALWFATSRGWVQR